jgi:hypothetical protein
MIRAMTHHLRKSTRRILLAFALARKGRRAPPPAGNAGTAFAALLLGFQSGSRCSVPVVARDPDLALEDLEDEGERRAGSG